MTEESGHNPSDRKQAPSRDGCRRAPSGKNASEGSHFGIVVSSLAGFFLRSLEKDGIALPTRWS